jgi:hypothetical protein
MHNRQGFPMTPQELADLLTGREYGSEITKAEEAQAKAAGLVVVFGAHDDLVVFRGAVDDVVDANRGQVFCIDREGLQRPWDAIEKDDIDARREYLRRVGRGQEVKAIWGEDGYLWTFKTEIPHAEFAIVDDGEPHCWGMVFALKDITP